VAAGRSRRWQGWNTLGLGRASSVIVVFLLAIPRADLGKTSILRRKVDFDDQLLGGWGTVFCCRSENPVPHGGKRSHARPRRTIRVALWGGEEQGMIGSRSWVAQHL
jgi:hypothetical protein